MLFIYVIFKSLKASGGGGDMFQMGKTNVKIFGVETKLATRFKDIAG